MTKSKQAKTPEGKNEVDFISNLPDHLLRLIISRLQGTEEEIRTSILSTRWRAEKLIISSPNLKNLRIETRQFVSDEEADADEEGLNWRMCSSLELSCPNLVVLKLTGFVAEEFDFKNLWSLKEVVMHVEELFKWEEPPYDLFPQFSHVEFLSTDPYSIQQLKVDAPLSLPNLKTLELTFDGIYCMDSVIPILKCLPNLESLHLTFPKHLYLLHKWKLDDTETMSILTRCLKKVEFRVFDEEKSKLAVTRALLEHGNALEEMVFSWTLEDRFDERSMEIMNQVSKFHKASLDVKIRCVINPSQANPRPARNIIEIGQFIASVNS